MLNAPPREREWVSWLYVVVWTMVIYVTIPFARPLQEFILDHVGRHLFADIVLSFIVIAVGAMVLYVARLRVSALWRRYLWAVVVGGAYLFYLWKLRHNPEEALHFIEYGVLGALLYRALSHRVRDVLIYVAAALVGTIIGTLDEVIQWLTPRRFWDLRDVLLNAISVILILVGIWRVLRPSIISLKIGPSSVRLSCRLGIALALLIGFSQSNTPSRVERYAKRIPGLGYLVTHDSVMTEYGYLHSDPEIGTFKSRFTLEGLADQDARRGAEAADILDRYRHPRKYGDFLKTYTPIVDPFVHEARVHLYRRDHYLGVLWKHADNEQSERYHATVAYRENQIMEKYFSNTLAHSRYVLKPSDIAFIEQRLLADEPYASPVSSRVIVSYTEGGAWMRVGLLAVLLAAVDVYYGWRKRKAHAPG